MTCCPARQLTGVAMLAHSRLRLPLAAILLLLVSAAGCTGSGEPAVTATATRSGPGSGEPAVTATATRSGPGSGEPAVTATATRSGPIDISSGSHTLTEGAYRYSYGSTTLFFDVPAGLRLNVGGTIVSEPLFWLLLEDLDSQSRISIDVRSGLETDRRIDPARSDASTLFRELMRSVRISPPPTPTPMVDYAPTWEALPARRVAGAVAAPRDISGWQFTSRSLHAGVYHFALNPQDQPLILEVPQGLSLWVNFSGPMVDASDQCPGLRLDQQRSGWGVAWLCLDVHQAVELSRSFGPSEPAATEAEWYDIGRLFNKIVASLRLGPVPSDDATAPCAPLIEMSQNPAILTGGSTYLWRRGTATQPPFVTIDIPASVTLESSLVDGSARLKLEEATSGSRLVIDLATGEEVERRLLAVPALYDLDLGSTFDQILASLRFDELPAIPGCPGPAVPSLVPTLGAGIYRYHFDPDRYQGAVGLPDITFEVPEGLQLELHLVRPDDEPSTRYQVRLTQEETMSQLKSWICLDAELVAECGRWIKPGDEHIEPLFDELSESLRPGTAP